MAAASLLALVATACTAPVREDRPEAGPGTARDLLRNVDFESGVAGWEAQHATLVEVPGRGGGRGLRLGADPRSTDPWGGATQASATTPLARATHVRSSIWVRSEVPGQRVRLRLVEEPDPARDATSGPADAFSEIRTVGTGWNRLTVTAVTRTDGAALRLVVTARRLDLSAVTIDSAVVRPVANPVVRVLPRGASLSNGCSRNRRGVPVCSAYVGGAYGGNTDPAGWESQLSHGLGLRRTYWGPLDRTEAIDAAREDIAHHRLPWISFKLPLSWTAMADGRGDQWLTQLARGLADVPGPVWLTLHHEPEGDGPILEWKRMQEHCGPLVRLLAPNVGFAVILTGWNQLYGPDTYSLDRIWPRTKVDVAGFDVYDFEGTFQDGRRLPGEDTTAKYLEPLADWAARHRVPWALGETGLTALAARRDPHWMRRTYQDMVTLGGVAFSYFNSGLNSTSDWRLNTVPKREQFSQVHRLAPRL